MASWRRPHAEGLVTLTGIIGQLAGAPRQALLFAVIHAVFTALFTLVYVRDHKANALPPGR